MGRASGNGGGGGAVGLVDWLAIRSGTRAKRVGLVHALGNLVVLGLFASARALRGQQPPVGPAKWL